MSRRDPIQRAADGARDLYGIVSWEPRSRFDRASVRLHRALHASGRAIVVLLALIIVVSQVALVAAATAREPVVGLYILLSVVPALGLAAYVWRADVTMREPLWVLTATYILGIIFSGFALVLNTVLGAVLRVPFGVLAGPDGPSGLLLLAYYLLLFFLVVGPIEETVKWLAVRLYAYRTRKFDAVIDGAVYGAVAGLGFATIENGIYIVRGYNQALASDVQQVLLATGGTAFVRLLAGPGHVIYSAFAGYYLGLAKYNPDRRGPIVVKGLLIAALIHGAYNSLSYVVSALSREVPALAAFPDIAVTVGFVVVYDSIFGYLLYRKLKTYRRTFRETGASRLYEDASEEDVERDEFEWDRRSDPEETARSGDE